MELKGKGGLGGSVAALLRARLVGAKLPGGRRGGCCGDQVTSDKTIWRDSSRLDRRATAAAGGSPPAGPPRTAMAAPATGKAY